MKKRHSNWLKNGLILMVLLLLAGGCYLFSVARRYQTDFLGAIRILREKNESVWNVGEPELEILSTEVSRIYVEHIIQGNHYVGEDFPAGVYELDAGNGEFLYRVCQGGEILREGMVSSKEGSPYSEWQSGISLQEGQILILLGEGSALLQSEEKVDYVYYPAGKDVERDPVITLGPGSYTVGEELPAGKSYLTLASEDLISIATSRPYEGGVELTRDPEKGDRSELYWNVHLQEGDTVSIQGGEVTFTYVVEVE